MKKIVYKGFIVMDSTEQGIKDKCRKIDRGDVDGFYKTNK